MKTSLTYTYDSETRDAIVTALEESYLMLMRAHRDAKFDRSYDKAQEYEDQAEKVLATIAAIDKAES